MKMEIRKLFIPFYLGFVAAAVAVENPLPVPVESSVLRHNGMYYSMGTQTNGMLLTKGVSQEM